MGDPVRPPLLTGSSDKQLGKKVLVMEKYQRSTRQLALRRGAFLCIALAFVFCGVLGQAEPRLSIVVRRSIDLSAALPQLVRACLLPGNYIAILSQGTTEPAASLGIFRSSGALVKNLAGTNIPTGLSLLTSLQAESDGTLWATTFEPAEVARLNRDGVTSANSLSNLLMAYALVVDQTHGYIYVSGCAAQHRGPNPYCLLVHQFAINGVKLRRSFLQTDPSVLRNTQFGVQWVPLDVDTTGVVWAVDSPAFTLYSIEPDSGRVTSRPIRSRLAVAPGKLNPVGGSSYTREYLRSSFYPVAVITTGNWVIVAIRRPGQFRFATYLLEIFNSAGVQVGLDIPAPGRLVGKYGGGGVLFGSSGKNGPILIEAVLSGLSQPNT